jgi:hypothetical protein
MAPPGSPLRTLTEQDAVSPVTTSSDVQAMALDHLPGGLGTPSVVGVLLFAALGALAYGAICSAARASRPRGATPRG